MLGRSHLPSTPTLQARKPLLDKPGQAMRPTLILPAGGKTGKQNSVLNFATVASSLSVSVPSVKRSLVSGWSYTQAPS